MGVPEETNLVSFGSQILEKKAERCKALLLLFDTGAFRCIIHMLSILLVRKLGLLALLKAFSKSTQWEQLEMRYKSKFLWLQSLCSYHKIILLQK